MTTDVFANKSPILLLLKIIKHSSRGKRIRGIVRFMLLIKLKLKGLVSPLSDIVTTLILSSFFPILASKNIKSLNINCITNDRKKVVNDKMDMFIFPKVTAKTSDDEIKHIIE